MIMPTLRGFAVVSLLIAITACAPVISATAAQGKSDGIPLVVEEVSIGSDDRFGVRNPGTGLGFLRMKLVNTGSLSLRTVILSIRAQDAVGNPIVNQATGDDVVEIRLSQVLSTFDPESITLAAEVAAASGVGIWGPFVFATSPSCIEIVSIDLGAQGVLEGAALRRATRDTSGNMCAQQAR